MSHMTRSNIEQWVNVTLECRGFAFALAFAPAFTLLHQHVR